MNFNFSVTQPQSGSAYGGLGLPVMGQQIFDLAVALRGQPIQDILEIGVGVEPVEAGRLDQAHDGGGPLAGPLGAGKEPVAATQGDGPDQVLDVVVVHRQRRIVEEAGQRGPALEAVVECLGRGGGVGELDALQRHPFMPGVHDRTAGLLAGLQPLGGTGIADQSFDLVDLLDEFECGGCQGALAGLVQFECKVDQRLNEIPWQIADGRLLLTCHLQPGAKKPGFAVLHGDAVKIRIASPPVDGKANAELIKFLAKNFAVAARDIEIISGQMNRRKRVAISGVETLPLSLQALLQ